MQPLRKENCRRMGRFLFVFNSRLAKYGSFEDFMIELGYQIRERGEEAGFVFPAILDEDVANEIRKVGKVFVAKGDWRKADGVSDILNIVREFSPVCVNTHFCDFNSFFFFYSCLRRLGVRSVYHYHGEILPIENMQWWKRYVSSIRFFSWCADLIITVSEANKRFLEFLNVRPEIKVVYNGIKIDRFLGHRVDYLELKKYGIEEKEEYICYLGSLDEERKRVRWLLEVFADIRKKWKGKLLVMGKGDIEKFKRIAMELGIGDSVIFTGVMKEYPFGLIKGAKLFVSASEQESFGLVFAEALLLGVPVVACRVGGIPEVVIDGKSGILVDKDDKEGFVNAVLYLLRNKELRQKMANFGANCIKLKFPLSQKVQELILLLNGGF